MSESVRSVDLGPRIDRRAQLSSLQSGIWTAQRLTPTAPLANMATAHRITGPVDPDRFVRAVDHVVRATEILRTVIDDRPGREPQALVLHDPPATTAVIDLDADDLASWCSDRIATPIDATACVYDSVLLRHGADDWTWWLDLHHVATDAWASMLVFEAVAAEYARDTHDDHAPPAPGPPPSFFDVVAGIDRSPASSADWGLDEVGGAITPYGPRGARTTEVSRHHVHHDDPGDDATSPPERYRTLSAELTTTVLLATAMAATLSRLDGRRSIVLGLPVHHRSGPHARATVGPMMAVCPLRVDVDPDATFGELFDEVHRGVLTTMRRARGLEAPHTGFDAVVNVQTARYDDFAGMATTSSWHRSLHVEAAHPVRVHAHDYGSGLRLELDLNDSLSVDGSHLALPGQFERLLRAGLADPDAVVGDVDLLSPDDREALAALDPPALDGSLDAPVHEVIARRLRDDGSWIVADDDTGTVTADRFDRRAELVAAALAASGVGPGARVGIRMERSVDVLVAMHGTLRAGAAFVMLDPDDPDERHRAIELDADLALVIDEIDALVERGRAAGVDLDVEPGAASVDVSLDDLAYVVYTSGSTGTPKGVPISHRGLADYLSNSVDAYRVPPGHEFVMPLHSALVFDLSITSLFLPHLVGGRTVVVGGDPLTALGAIAADGRLTVLKATPSQLEILARLADGPLGLDVVIVGGEAFRRPVAERIAALAPGVRIFNEYGPAEAVVGCMLHEWDPEVDTGVDVPIGVATPGAEIHVLDQRAQPTPPGSWGELYVWRTGMADGYLGLPDATREKFARVAGLGDRVRYRTGDRVRLEHGVLVYGGRIDDQLSVSGVRLEPGEIEAALLRHPDVTNAVVRVWNPGHSAVEHCVSCGLGTDVPGVSLADDGRCSICHEFERVEPQTRSWFRTPADLDAALAAARERATGDVDCLHLLSGGKDSTYALYQLVERGWRVHALTLDNGFISDGAKENIRRSVADLGITHEFATTDAMDEIFRDSLERFANVCNGCYKTIYTLATARAHELGIPVIVTGLSRGQFFETRLVPHQFEADRFDPEAIDRTVLQARRAYHATRDAVTELLPEQTVFDRTDIDVLSEIEYLDFYRYVDVELAEMYEFLEQRAPWVRPDDTGRSTNCLVNVAGIHTHLTERGYHNYAEPYAWDVRLGHKTRAEALDELDDVIDPAEIEPMLEQIGYRPRRPDVLTAWYQTVDDQPSDTRLLSAHLREILPSRSIPTAYVHVDDLPLADSTKLDVRSLPAPSSIHLGSASYVEPATPTEAAVAAIWADVLDVERVGADDDFFDLGGASLAALETVAATERHFGVELPDALVFEHRRVREFAAAVDAVVADGRELETIPPLDPAAPVPLSPGEEAMLFEYRTAPHDVRYNGTRHYRVPAEIDPERLRRAVHTVVERHQPLHTAYDDRRTRLPAEQAASIEPIPPGPLAEFLDRQRAVPFDLDHGPLVRIHVRPSEAPEPSQGSIGRGDTAGPAATDIVIAMHHISVDAGTFDLFWNELDAAYHDRALPPLDTTYAAHGAWQRTQVRPGSLPITATDDRTGVSLPPVGGASTASDADAPPDGYIDRPASVTTSELRSGAGATPFGAALTATAVVLGAFSRDGSVELGVTASTKDHPAADDLIGYFLNSLPIVVDVDPTASLAALESAVNDRVTELLPHRAEPFADIVRAARRDGRTAPDISFMLAYERLAPPSFGDAPADLSIVMAPTAVNDLTFFVHEQGDDLSLGLEYRGSVVGHDTAQRLLDGFDHVLTALCRTPGAAAATARALLSADDLVGPPLSSHPVTPVVSVVDHAARRPSKVAAVDADGSTTTYGELTARATDIAAALTARGVRLGDRVGVSLPRSADLLAAVVGVHLVGAAYVPIDPTAPVDRVGAIVAVADLAAVVVAGAPADHRFEGLATVDLHAVDTRDRQEELTSPQFDPDDVAYVIFTSGSTGEPAGVEVSHGNLAASTAARPLFYGDEPPGRFLLTPSIGFDSSMVAIFWPLAAGGAVVVPGDDAVHDVDRLGDLVDELGVTHLLMVPSLYQALLDRRAHRLQHLHTAIVAGEACPPSLVRRHHRLLPQVDLVNEYGPTEATVWAAAHRCESDDDPVPVGRPIAGARLRVADERQRPVAAGSPGELLIAGPGVVAGYRSGRSDDAFVDDGEHRWYRTGDLTRIDERGDVVFLGRVDDQLNVGGLRVEPLEIEGTISELPGVDDVVVTAALVDGRESLVAHLVGNPTSIDTATVRSHVTARLGAAAAPRRVALHDSLPRTSNGKLDRARARTLPLSPAAGEATRAPSGGDSASEIGGQLDAIWRRALGVDDLGPDADFFEAGGDSLAAVAVVSALGDLVGRDVPVATLLTSPTPRRMAAALGLTSSRAASSGRAASVDGETPVVTTVTLRPGEPGGPVVVMTPAWDSVMGYHALANAFTDDVRVVAVVVTDVDEGSSLVTVPELGDASIDVAADALDGLELPPDTPLAVLGWSIGGVAAYDLGRRLHDRGVDVTSIVLVDTFFPGEHHHLWSNRWWKYKAMLRSGAVREAMRELATMGRRRFDKLLVKLGRRLITLGGGTVERPRIETTGSGVPRTALDGDPEPTTLPVLLFAADGTNPDRTINRWRTVADQLSVAPVRGSHRGFQSVMGADRVHVIADEIDRRILRHR